MPKNFFSVSASRDHWISKFAGLFAKKRKWCRCLITSKIIADSLKSASFVQLNEIFFKILLHKFILSYRRRTLPEKHPFPHVLSEIRTFPHTLCGSVQWSCARYSHESDIQTVSLSTLTFSSKTEILKLHAFFLLKLYLF